MKKKINFLIILIAGLLLVTSAGADKTKKEVKSETNAIQKPSVPDVKTTDQPTKKLEIKTSPQQSFKVSIPSINSGGGVNLSATNYKMGVTAGQSVIGEASSTNYKMGLGFWYGAPVPSGPLCTDKAGDANGSGSTPNLTDIIYLVSYVFKGGPAPNPLCRGNANGSTGAPNLTDIIYLVSFVFKGGPAPVKSGVCCL